MVIFCWALLGLSFRPDNVWAIVKMAFKLPTPTHELSFKFFGDSGWCDGFMSEVVVSFPGNVNEWRRNQVLCKYEESRIKTNDRKHFKSTRANHSSIQVPRMRLNEVLLKYKDPRPSTTQTGGLNSKSINMYMGMNPETTSRAARFCHLLQMCLEAS
nr:hypothetical protein [Tanacetum cinerariifolium]